MAGGVWQRRWCMAVIADCGLLWCFGAYAAGRYLHLDLGLQLQLAFALRHSRDAILGELYELLVCTQIT